MTAPELDDEAFLAAFEADQPPGGSFRHADHVRLAWLLLRRDGARAGEERIVSGIRRFAAAQGTPGLFHETLTRAWCRLVGAALAESPRRADWPSFLAAHPQLGDKSYVFRFYSAEALSLPAARSGWMPPDLAPLPPFSSARLVGTRGRLLSAAFLAGALTDAVPVIPLVLPAAAALLWGFDDDSGAGRLTTGYAASLMLAWAGLLLWARRRPLERAFVAPLTVLALYGLVASEIAAVVAADIGIWRMTPTWILQVLLITLFATAYHWPAPRILRALQPRG